MMSNLAKNNFVFVAGNFDGKSGRKSSVMEQLFLGIVDQIGSEVVDKTTYCNGGNISQIEDLLTEAYLSNFIFWFPNIDNNKIKYARKIKKINRTAMLVTSKRNFDEYEFQDVVAHGLRYKSNLVLEISKYNNKYIARVLDPLGNIFCKFDSDFFKIGKILANRIENLSNFTKISGKAHDFSRGMKAISLF